MRSKILVLWGLPWFSKRLFIHTIHVYGDSKSLIEGVSAITDFSPPKLSSQISHINFLKQSFHQITFQHIFRESNSVADSLSKKGLTDDNGYMHFVYLEEETIMQEGSILLPQHQNLSLCVFEALAEHTCYCRIDKIFTNGQHM